MTATLSAEDLELARQISLRRGYLRCRAPQVRAVSLRRWLCTRHQLRAELDAMERTARAQHGSVATLLTAAGLPACKSIP